MIPAIGYIRVSLAREEMISPDIQKGAIARWAAQNDREIVDYVVDLDMSGRNFRRKVVRAVERIEAREAREIVVYRYDRWGRNAVESLANIRRVEMVGGQLQSATEPLDAETAIGRYSRTNALALAEMQSDVIGENWRSAHQNRVERGLTGSGTPRFGYIRLGRIHLPDPTTLSQYRRDPSDPKGERYEPDYEGGTADVLVEMYDRYIRGDGVPKVMRWLNEQGIPNARGRIWNTNGVGDVLDSGFGAGLLRIHDCRCEKWKSCPNKTYLPGAHDAVIDARTWQAYLDARKVRGKMAPRARGATYPLSGLIRCGHCHSAMVVFSGGYRRVAGYGYRCARWMASRDCPAPFPKRAVVEERVLDVLREWAADVDARTLIREEPQRAPELDAARFERRRAEIDRQLVNLMKERAADGGKTPAAIWDQARDELLAERAAVEKQLAQGPEQPVQRHAFEPVLMRLLVAWEFMTAVERRELLAQMVRHVAVRRTEGREFVVEVAPVWEPCGCPHCTDSLVI